MSAKVIRRLTEALIGLFMLGVVINIVKAVASAVSGSFGTVHWTASTTEPVRRTLGDNGSYNMSHGTMSVEGQPFLGFIDLIASLAMLGVLIVALLALRKLLLNFADGQFFDEPVIGVGRQFEPDGEGDPQESLAARWIDEAVESFAAQKGLLASVINWQNTGA